VYGSIELHGALPVELRGSITEFDVVVSYGQTRGYVL